MTSRRDLEDGIQRDFRNDMSYGDYLRLDQLLAAQHPLSDPPQHDELLFIIQHQTSELWLKLMVHELRSARSLLAGDELSPALKRMARIKHIQHTLTDQWAVLATLTPSEYAEIRPFLATSSGFQSAQYREVEFLLGNKNADMVQVFDHDPAAQAALSALLHEPSLYDEFLAFLARAGLRRPRRAARPRLVPAPPAQPRPRRHHRAGLRRARRALGRLRDLRGARRHRGQLPAVAVPAPAGGAAHDRPQDGHRRLQRRRLPAPCPGPDLLPRALRGAHPHRRLSAARARHNGRVLLADVVTTSAEVAAPPAPGRPRWPRSPTLPRARPTRPSSRPVTSYLARLAAPAAHRPGLAWRCADAARRPRTATLTVAEVARGLRAARRPVRRRARRPGRAAAVADLFGRATERRADLAARAWSRGRSGRVRSTRSSRRPSPSAAEVPLALGTPGGDAGRGARCPVVRAAFEGGEAALADVGLEVGRPVLPMLASSAPDVAAALAKAGGDRGRPGREARRHPDPGAPRRRRGPRRHPQPRRHHRPAARGGRRGPGAARDAASCSTARRSRSTRPGGPRAFQETASRTAQAAGRRRHAVLLRPAAPRRAATCSTPPPPSGWPRSTRLVPEANRVPRLVTGDPEQAAAFLTDALAAGPRGRGREEPRRALRRRPARRRPGSRSSPCTPSTWSCSPSSGAAAGARAGCPTSTSVPATPRAASSSCWARPSRG